MAISKESLEVSINVDTKNASKEVKDFSESTQGLSEVVKKLDEIQKVNSATLATQIKALEYYGNIQREQVRTTAELAKETSGLSTALANTFYSVGLATQATDGWSDAAKTFLGLGFAGGIALVATKFGYVFSAVDKATKIFTAFGSAVKSNVGSIFHAVEATSLMAPALLLFSNFAKDSENALVRFTAKIASFVAIVSTGFVGILAFATGLVGSFFENMGDKIISSLSASEEKFMKFEMTMKKFTFTLAGFSKAFGDDVVGSLEKWNGVVDDIFNSTTFTRESIIKAAKLFIAEGSVLGLTAEQNEKLLKRTADIAAATGESIEDVSQKVVSALTNNAQAVLSLGIDLRESSLAHTEYAKSSGLAIEQMTDQQVALLRMNALFEKTTPIVGAAAAAIDTVQGSNLKYEKTIDSIKIKLGEAGIATRAYLTLQNKFAEWFASTPDVVLSFIGTIGDFAGVLLKVTGLIIKFGLGFYTATFVFKLALKLINGLTGSALSLGSSLAFVASRVVPIVGLFLAVSEAIDQLTKENEAFAQTLDEVAKAFSVTETKAEGAAQSISIFSKAIQLIVEPIKLAIVGIAQLINFMAKVGVATKRAFSSDNDDIEAMDMQIEELDKRINLLSKSSEKSVDALNIFGSSTAYAATYTDKLNSAIKSGADLFGDYKTRVIKQAKEINSAYDENVERIKVLGDEYEKAVAGAKSAQSEMEKVFRQKISEKDAAQKYADAERAANQANLEIEKMRLDVLKQGVEQQRQLQVESLRQRGKNIAALRIEAEEQVAAIDRQIAGIKKLGGAKEEDLKALEKNKKLILSISYSKILEEQDKYKSKIKDIEDANRALGVSNSGFIKNEIASLELETQERLDAIQATEKQMLATGDLSEAAKGLLATQRELTIESGKLKIQKQYIDTLDDIAQKNMDLSNQINSYGETRVNILESEYREQVRLLDIEKERLIQKGLLSKSGANTTEQKALEEGIERQRSLLKKKLEIDLEAAPTPFVEGAQALTGGPIVSMIDTMQSLIDFIPNLLDKVTNLFNSLTDLPNKIVAGLSKAFDSVLNFVSNFIPSLVAAIPKVFEKAIEFLQKLPQAFAGLLAKLPNMLVGLLDKLPWLAREFSKELVKNAAKIASAFVKALIKNGPMLAKEISFFLAIELPRAIAQGILEGLRDVLSGNFSLGDMFNTEGLTDTFKKMGEALGESTNRIFNVSDLTDATMAPSEALANAAKAVSDSFTKGASWIAAVWQHWMDVVMGFWRSIMASFNALWDNVKVIFKGFIDGLYGVWTTIRDMIVVPFINAIKDAWAWVKANIIDPLLNGLASVRAQLADTLQPLIGFGKKIVDGLRDSLRDLMPKLFDAFYNVGKNMVSGLVDGLGNIGGMIGKVIGSLPSINVSKSLGFAEGGIIPGNAVAFGDSPRNDVIPAMLSPGEAVIPRSAMQDPFIAETVKSILNNRTIPAFSEGLMPRFSGGGAGDTAINLGGITIHTTQNIDGDFVKSKLMPTIQKELRRASLDGQTVIYKAGIR